MKKTAPIIKTFLIFLFVLVLITPIFGETYYVTKTGSNSYNGTSWATAWETIIKVNTTISHGDTIYFGTGEWLGSQIIPPAGTSEPYTLYACSTGTLESAHLATIWSGTEITTWTAENDSIWKATWNPSEGSSYPNYPCVVGEDFLYKMETSLGNLIRPGYAFYDYSSDMLYIHPYEGDDPDVTGEKILASYQTGVVGFTDGMTRYTKFFGLNLKMGHNGAIYFQADWRHSFNIFDNCTIAHNTTGTANNSSVIYMGGIGSDNPDTLLGYSYGNVFRACSIYSANCSYSEYISHAGSGATFYGMRQTVFDSCYFKMLPGSGVMWKGGGFEYYGNRVSYCTFDGTDSMAYGLNSFSNYVIEHACGAQVDSAYGNIFKNMYHPGAAAFGISPYECQQPVTYCGGDFFCNNTAYNCNTFFFAAIDWSDDTLRCDLDLYGNDLNNFEDVFIKYNVLQKVIDNSRWISDGYDGPAGRLFMEPTICKVDSNLWYDEAGGEDFKYFNGQIRSWDYWQSTLGHDANGDTVSAGFNDPENGDFGRPLASGEMDRDYGGRHWDKFGADQSSGESEQRAPINKPIIRQLLNIATGRSQ